MEHYNRINEIIEQMIEDVNYAKKVTFILESKKQ